VKLVEVSARSSSIIWAGVGSRWLLVMETLFQAQHSSYGICGEWSDPDFSSPLLFSAVGRRSPERQGLLVSMFL
jgi:hypothetical protein